MTDGAANLPDGTIIDYTFANGSSGFKVWKERGGSRILPANGLVASGNWQKQLTRAGTAFSATDFILSSTNIAGRVCPTHVFLSHSEMTATGRCLYYDAGIGPQRLDAAGTSSTEASDWLQDWNQGATGRGISSSYYEGNIKTCADKGMRLPTMYETRMPRPGGQLPTGDGITPTWAGSTNGVPGFSDFWIWTASVQTNSPSAYWIALEDIYAVNEYWRTHYVRCVLP
jgi:hypothetical protein